MAQHERVNTFHATQARLDKAFVAYWCSNTYRVRYNHSLEYAIHLANKYKAPLVVFTIHDELDVCAPRTANARKALTNRHAAFELRAAQEMACGLKHAHIACCHLIGQRLASALYVADNAIAMVLDAEYLQEPRELQYQLLTRTQCPLIRVESNVVVPVQSCSQKAEYAAYTIRPKIHSLMEKFLAPLVQQTVESPSLNFASSTFYPKFPVRMYVDNTKHTITRAESERLCDAHAPSLPGKFFENSADSFLPPSTESDTKKSGFSTVAQKILAQFIAKNLASYHELSRDPSALQGQGVTSGLSPYLRIGAISPVDIVLQIRSALEEYAIVHSQDTAMLDKLSASYETFFEQLVVRRELAFNFVYYNKDYHSYKDLPLWATQSLEAHKTDPRIVQYSSRRLEQADTSDPYWNAAQRQLVDTGSMHGYMRMYWGKKIIEWTEDPEDAFDFAIAQNNRFALDAPDPNGYAGIAWCFGTHDRPHPTRPIFGSLRYMNANGLRRKFDIDTYVARYLKE